MVTACSLIAGALLCYAQDRAARIREKAERVERQAKELMIQGRNPLPAIVLMKQASQAFDRGDADAGERLIDQAMQKIENIRDQKPGTSLRAPGMAAGLYGAPEPVEIVGYAQDAMEPCISLDGKYLFFNNSNETPDTHLFYARRVSDKQFKFLGPLPGVRMTSDPKPSWDEREMAPSIDRANNFFFTCTHSYRADRKTLYAGKFTGDKVTNVQPVEGDISPKLLTWLNMDCGISPDASTLFIARAMIRPGDQAPSVSDLLMATRRSDGTFEIDKRSHAFLKSINTAALEYAPCITDDGLELYFTRAQTLDTADPKGPVTEIMVARRNTKIEPFGSPVRIAGIEGFAEAPSLTRDKRELYFHKRADSRFRIFRCSRSRAAGE